MGHGSAHIYQYLGRTGPSMETVDKKLDKIVREGKMNDIKEKITSFIKGLFCKKAEMPDEKVN